MRSLFDEMKSRLRKPYRARRQTPRPGMEAEAALNPNSVAWEDPAPPWVAAVIDTLAKPLFDRHPAAEAETVITWALRWCDAGDARQRAEHLLTAVKLWPGGIAASTWAFLKLAGKTDRGRTTGSKYRPVEVVHIPEAWPNEKPAIEIEHEQKEDVITMALPPGRQVGA